MENRHATVRNGRWLVYQAGDAHRKRVDECGGSNQCPQGAISRNTQAITVDRNGNRVRQRGAKSQIETCEDGRRAGNSEPSRQSRPSTASTRNRNRIGGIPNERVRTAESVVERPHGSDRADLISNQLRKPQIAVRTAGNPDRIAAGRGGDGKLRDHAGGGDPPDLIPGFLRKPQIAVWSTGDPDQGTKSGDGKLRDYAANGDFPNVIPELFRKPQIAVGTAGDPVRRATGSGDGKLRDRTRGGDSPNLVPRQLREPQVAVRPAGDPFRVAA